MCLSTHKRGGVADGWKDTFTNSLAVGFGGSVVVVWCGVSVGTTGETRSRIREKHQATSLTTTIH